MRRFTGFPFHLQRLGPLAGLLTLALFLLGTTACSTFQSGQKKEDELAQIRKELQEIQRSLSDVNLKLANSENKIQFLEARLNELGRREGTPPEPAKPAPEESKKPDPPETAVRLDPELESLPPDELYQRAIFFFNQKNYPLSIQLLRRFVGKNPSSEFADKAQYWIGEAYFVQGDFERALKEYSRTIEQYPNGNKTPDAFLKSAMAYDELKEPGKATEILMELVERYPASSAATVANMKLTKRQRE
jgi:tol-pal system protein YbgF